MPRTESTTAPRRPMRIDPEDPRFRLLAKEIVAAWRRSRPEAAGKEGA